MDNIIYRDNYYTISVCKPGIYGNAGKDFYINHSFGMLSDPFKSIETTVPVARYIASKLAAGGSIKATIEKCF